MVKTGCRHGVKELHPLRPRYSGLGPVCIKPSEYLAYFEKHSHYISAQACLLFFKYVSIIYLRNTDIQMLLQ